MTVDLALAHKMEHGSLVILSDLQYYPLTGENILAKI
jgi:hypothetical protein